MKKFWEDFKKFINRGNVVDMAVGVAVASAFTAIVTAFTKGFISPLLALLTGESGMEEMKWIIREEILDGETVVQAEVAILWGAFVQALINFIIIAFSLFLVIKIAASISNRAAKISNEVKNRLSGEDKEAEARAKAEAEAAEKEAAEREAAAKAEAERLEKEKAAALEARSEAEIELLREIRDLIKGKE